MTYTFTKDEILKKGDFQGARWSKYRETPHFLLLLHENNGGAKRIGITIRKKAGGAVIRNRMKRMVREFFRLNKDLFIDGQDNLIKVKQIPQKMSWNDTKEELQSLLSVSAHSRDS
jgi:ribonuclease P protein component